MIDVHCHLNFHSFEKDYDFVIQEAQKKGVSIIVNVGTKLDSSQKAVDMAKKYGNLYAIVGVHPHHADKPMECHNDIQRDWIKELEQIALSSKKVVAIGEIGMDYYSYKSNGIVDPKLQKETFVKQIELAHKLKLPLQIHNRLAGKDILEILIHHKNYLLEFPGMFHCFSGNKEFAKKVLDMGFFVGFDGNITYEGTAPGEDTSIKVLASYVPMERIVIETDSPYLTPVPYRGSRNEPSHAIITGRFLAQLKRISFDEVDRITTKNAHAIFQLGKDS